MNETVERLASVLHDIYQVEARRQAVKGEDEVRHPDDYAALPEHTKEYDRVLARFILGREEEMRNHVNGTTELMTKLSTEVSSLRALSDRVLDERDAARALADQLARALGVLGSVFSVIDWTDSDHMPFDGPVIDKAWADEVRPVLDDWEARDWKLISPPGSGLDGLLADINRDD